LRKKAAKNLLHRNSLLDIFTARANRTSNHVIFYHLVVKIICQVPTQCLLDHSSSAIIVGEGINAVSPCDIIYSPNVVDARSIMRRKIYRGIIAVVIHLLETRIVIEYWTHSRRFIVIVNGICIWCRVS